MCDKNTPFPGGLGIKISELEQLHLNCIVNPRNINLMH